jgi:hypothetical protein
MVLPKLVVLHFVLTMLSDKGFAEEISAGKGARQKSAFQTAAANQE